MLQNRTRSVLGDTLFEGSVGRWDRPMANIEQLKASVLSLIDNEQEQLIIHPGHGISSTIGTENSIIHFITNGNMIQ